MIEPHARTLSIVRFLRAAAPALHRRRGGRLPRQQQPDTLRLEYFNALMGIVRPQFALYDSIKPELLRLLADERREQGKMDTDGKRRAKDVIARAGQHAENAYRPRDVFNVAEEFGTRTSKFQREQLDRQVRQAVGVPFSLIEKPIRDLVPAFAAENVTLVKTIGTRYHGRLAAETEEAFETGMSVDTFADRLVDLDDIAESDARRIARDQIGKLNGEFNQERQESIGVTRFAWRTAKDNRVRDSHADLDGESFEWDDPPVDDETGEVITPGSAIQCRCYGDPDLSEIIDGL